MCVCGGGGHGRAGAGPGFCSFSLLPPPPPHFPLFLPSRRPGRSRSAALPGKVMQLRLTALPPGPGQPGGAPHHRPKTTSPVGRGAADASPVVVVRGVPASAAGAAPGARRCRPGLSAPSSPPRLSAAFCHPARPLPPRAGGRRVPCACIPVCGCGCPPRPSLPARLCRSPAPARHGLPAPGARALPFPFPFFNSYPFLIKTSPSARFYINYPSLLWYLLLIPNPIIFLNNCFISPHRRALLPLGTCTQLAFV